MKNTNTQHKTQSRRTIPIALLTTMIASSAWGQSFVTIQNPGFEDPVIPTVGGFETGIPDWSSFNGGSGGVLNPAASDFPALAPQGTNVASIFSSVAAQESGVSQALSVTLQENATYTLSVNVGDSLTFANFPGYRVQLLAGGSVLAEDNNSLTITEGQFTTSTVVYAYNIADAALLGQPFEIRLLSKGLATGTEVNFDGVQLAVSLADPAADPGGPYSVSLSGSLSLDGSNSLPSDGATITAWDWDLDNNGTFGDVTGANPASITNADLQTLYGMSIGANTIQLRVTDSAAKSSIAQATVTLTALPAPAAYWPLRDGNPGDTVPTGTGNAAAELIGAGLTFSNGTVNNTNSTWQADPTRGIVWSTTEGNRMTMGQQGIDLNNGFTWSFWANVASSNITDPGADVIIGTRQGSATSTSTTAWHKVDLGGVSAWNGSMSIPNLADDTWHHVAYVGDLSGRKFYVDGVEVGSNNSIVVQTIDRILELGGTSQFSEDVTGLYSDLAIWNARLSEGEIQDLASGANVIQDATAPVIAATTPVDDDPATPVSQLQLILNEPVVIGGGNIRIVNDTDTVTTTIAVTDASQVTVSGASITITPSNPLLLGKNYHVEMDAGVVKNVGGLDFAGINDPTVWNFTSDDAPPVLVSISDNFAGGPVYENVDTVIYSVTFDEPINGSTVDATDFDNAGTATATVGTVTQITDTVFTVELLPTTTGTLILRIPTGSEIADQSANLLVVPVQDDTAITINPGNFPSITITGSDGGGDSWNVATNWDSGFIPFDVVPATVATGVIAQAQNAATAAYSGGLTLQSGSSLYINNTAGSQNALGTGPITFEGATIRMTLNVNPVNFPALVLNGDATFTTGGNTEDNKTRNLTGGVSGTGDLTLVGRNNLSWNFQAASTYTGNLNLQAVDRYRVNLNAAGAASVASITVTPRTSDDRSAVIILNASDVFSNSTTLTLNGRGGNNTSGYTGYARIDMKSFNATVDKLYIDDVQQPAGDYTSVGDNGNLANPLNWIAGTGTLTVLTGPGTGGAPYDTWAATNAPTGNPNDDFDGDGVPNAIEFVLGGLATTNDLDKLPAVATTGGDMTFTFIRDQTSVDASVSVEIEVGTDLAAWPDVYTVGGDTAGSSAGVTVTDNLDDTDTITLTVAQAPDTKKFARLKVVITP